MASLLVFSSLCFSSDCPLSHGGDCGQNNLVRFSDSACFYSGRSFAFSFSIYLSLSQLATNMCISKCPCDKVEPSGTDRAVWHWLIARNCISTVSEWKREHLLCHRCFSKSGAREKEMKEREIAVVRLISKARVQNRERALKNESRHVMADTTSVDGF